MERAIKPHERIERPIKPIEPDINDKKKYPPHGSMRNMTQEEVEKLPFIVDSEKYRKDKEKYDKDFAIWEQFRFIEDIKRSSVKLCMKKYTITLKK